LNPPEDILSSVSFASKASGSIGQEICPQLFLNERLKAKMLSLTKACQFDKNESMCGRSSRSDGLAWVFLPARTLPRTVQQEAVGLFEQDCGMNLQLMGIGAI
jgi:hypothetical protein